MSRPKPEAVSHDDLWKEIKAVERDMKRWVVGAVGALATIGFGAFATMWKDAADAARQVGSVAAQVQHNVNGLADALESQRRVEASISEINRFLREDSREQRESMSDHVRSMHHQGTP